ncbi:MAG: hypothetical protein MK086_00275 [Flavobacteriales bacterium]|nr:hypothetical protein [Flavobacteriales bacterium]
MNKSSIINSILFKFVLTFYQNVFIMKPTDMAKSFSNFMEEGTTPKGIKVQAFFGHLTDSEKRLVANNVSKAYASFLHDEKAKAEQRKKQKKEISSLRKKAKELGLRLVE